MDEKKYWQTDDPNVFLIGGRRFAIGKKGRGQAVQIAELNRWLKTHIAPLTNDIKSTTEGDAAGGLGIFLNFAGELSADAQMELAGILLGNKDVEGNPIEPAFLDEFYDIDWVIAATQVASKSGAVQNILAAFFTNIG